MTREEALFLIADLNEDELLVLYELLLSLRQNPARAAYPQAEDPPGD